MQTRLRQGLRARRRSGFTLVLVCRDDPDPAGAQNLLDVSDLSGDLVLTGSCVVGGGGNAVPIQSRAWSPVF